MAHGRFGALPRHAQKNPYAAMFATDLLSLLPRVYKQSELLLAALGDDVPKSSEKDSYQVYAPTVL